MDELDYNELRIPLSRGKKLANEAKDIVRNTVRVNKETEDKISFTYRGFYGQAVFFDMFAIVPIHISKKLPYPVTDDDYELAKTVTDSTHRHQGVLEINTIRNTCSAGGLLFLEPEFTEEMLLSVLNDCVDNLKDFFKEYNRQKSV